MSKLFILSQPMRCYAQMTRKLYVVEKMTASYLFREYDIHCPFFYRTESPTFEAKCYVEKMTKTVKPSTPILKTTLETSIEEWFRHSEFHKDRYYFQHSSFFLLSDEECQEFFTIVDWPTIDESDYYGKQEPYLQLMDLFKKSKKTQKSLEDQVLTFKKAESMITLTKKMLKCITT